MENKQITLRAVSARPYAVSPYADPQWAVDPAKAAALSALGDLTPPPPTLYTPPADAGQVRNPKLPLLIQIGAIGVVIQIITQHPINLKRDSLSM